VGLNFSYFVVSPTLSRQGVILRLVAYPHQQTFYADIFIQRFPMQT